MLFVGEGSFVCGFFVFVFALIPPLLPGCSDVIIPQKSLSHFFQNSICDQHPLKRKVAT